MDIVTGVELECSYGAGDGRTRSGVVSMPKERSGRPRLDRSCNWEKYGYDTPIQVRFAPARRLSFSYPIVPLSSRPMICSQWLFVFCIAVPLP